MMLGGEAGVWKFSSRQQVYFSIVITRSSSFQSNWLETCDRATTFAWPASALSASTPSSTPPTTFSHPHLNRLAMADALEYNRHEGERDEEEEEEEIDDTVGAMLV